MFSRTSRFEATPSSARLLDTKPTPCAIASAGLEGAIGSPSSVRRPAVMRGLAEDRAPDRVMAGAAQADESRVSPAATENETGPTRSATRPATENALRSEGGARPDEGVAHRAADDHLHEVAGVGFARLNRRQPASVAKHRHPVGDAEALRPADG